MGMEWIVHKGKKILYIKYSGHPLPEQLDLIMKASETLVATGVKDNLTLTDVRDIFASQEFVELAKVRGKISGAFTKKAAIIGVDGIKKILLKAVNTVSANPRKPFDDIEAAKDWLAE